MIYRLTFPLPESDNRRVSIGHKKDGKAFVYHPQAYRKMLEELRLKAKQQGFEARKKQPYTVKLVITLRRQNADALNILKCLMDGVFGSDRDQYVEEFYIKRRVDAANAGVQLEITELNERLI